MAFFNNWRINHSLYLIALFFIQTTMVTNKTKTKEVENTIIGIEIPAFYDWVCYYLDTETGKRYSTRLRKEIENDEYCRYGYIYKLKWIDEFTYEVISKRLDN